MLSVEFLKDKLVFNCISLSVSNKAVIQFRFVLLGCGEGQVKMSSSTVLCTDHFDSF